MTTEPTEQTWDEFRKAKDDVQTMHPDTIKYVLTTEHDEVFSDHWTEAELKAITKFLTWIKEGDMT